MNLYVFSAFQYGFDTDQYNYLLKNASNYCLVKISQIDGFVDKCNRLWIDFLLKTQSELQYGFKYHKGDIIANSFGKPFFTKNGLFFSISHSKKFGALILSKHPVGVDIEELPLSMGQVNINRLIDNILNKEEQKVGLVKIWTAKESFLKGLGFGLNYPINDVHFSQNKGYICTQENVSNKWWVKHIETNQFIASVSSSKHLDLKYNFIDNRNKVLSTKRT